MALGMALAFSLAVIRNERLFCPLEWGTKQWLLSVFFVLTLLGAIVDTMNEAKDKHPRRINAYSLLGFSIFDLIHIILGLYFFERAFREQGEAFQFDVAESSTEMVCSILLLLFILVIAKPNTHPEERHQFYTFAWIIATVSVLLPEVFKIPLIIQNGHETLYLILVSLQIGFSVLALSSFAAALFLHTDNRHWLITMVVGIVLFFLLVPISLTATIYESGEKGVYWTIFSIMINIAPLFPTGFALYSVFKNRGKKYDDPSLGQ